MSKKKRTYKDSLFTDLFYSDRDAKRNLIEMYNALYDENIVDAVDIQLMRIENTLFQSLRNDVSFVVGNRRIVLTEHQSTINENMPLRCLLYIAREYEQIIPVKSRYSKKQIVLPEPVFFVFYNGQEDYPAETQQRLSASFSLKDNNSLELCVKVININPAKNHPLLSKCKILNQYSTLVETVREFIAEGKSFEEAIDQCIHDGILSEYLNRKRKEVCNMLIAEYDYDMDIAVQREEAEEIGMKKGMKQGLEEGKILGVIETLRELGTAEDKILSHIMDKFSLTNKKASELMKIK